MTEPLPTQAGIGHDSSLFFFRKPVYDGRESADRFLHTFIRRSQFEPGIKRFEVAAKFLFEGLGLVVGGRYSFRHDTSTIIRHEETT